MAYVTSAYLAQDLLARDLNAVGQGSLQLATQIHNEPLQTLFLISNQLDALAGDDGVRDAARTLRRVTKDMRLIISGMRPAALARATDVMVRHVARDFAEQHDQVAVQIAVDVPAGMQLREKTHHAVYYVLTEALNNVTKHAQATAVRVGLWLEADDVVLGVADNGVGSKVTGRSPSELLRDGHMGLAGMHRWAALGGGELIVGAGDAQGVRLRLVLPLEMQ